MYYSSLNLLVISFDLFPHAWETSRNSDLSKLGYTQLCLWPTKLQGLEKIACSNKRTEGIKIAKVEVADPGEGPWGTPYFSTKMRPEELKKNFLETPLPLSQVWMTPPPIFEGLDLPLSIVAERAGRLTNFDKENQRQGFSLLNEPK